MDKKADCPITVVSLLEVNMSINVGTNKKGWKYHFDRRDKASKEGRHLPTLEELYCGMSFLNESLACDAQTWSERVIPCLAEKASKLTRSALQIALERLTVSACLQDLTLVYAETAKYETSSDLFAEVQRAARRLVVYRVAGGDISARSLLCEDLISRIRKLPHESAELWAISSTLLGLMLNMNRRKLIDGSQRHSLGDFFSDGESMLFRTPEVI